MTDRTVPTVPSCIWWFTKLKENLGRDNTYKCEQSWGLGLGFALRNDLSPFVQSEPIVRYIQSSHRSLKAKAEESEFFFFHVLPISSFCPVIAASSCIQYLLPWKWTGLFSSVRCPLHLVNFRISYNRVLLTVQSRQSSVWAKVDHTQSCWAKFFLCYCVINMVFQVVYYVIDSCFITHCESTADKVQMQFCSHHREMTNMQPSNEMLHYLMKLNSFVIYYRVERRMTEIDLPFLFLFPVRLHDYTDII